MQMGANAMAMSSSSASVEVELDPASSSPPCEEEDGDAATDHLGMLSSSSAEQRKEEMELPPFPPVYVSPGPPLRFKEVLLICLALLLLVCSVLLFFKHWKKNYRDINQLPYYAYLYQKDDDSTAAAAATAAAVQGPFLATASAVVTTASPPPPPVATTAVPVTTGLPALPARSLMVRAHSSCNVYRTNLLPSAHKQHHKSSLHNVDSIMAFRDEHHLQQHHHHQQHHSEQYQQHPSSNDQYLPPQRQHSSNLLRPVCGPGGRSLNRAASSPRLMLRTNSGSGKGHYRLSSVVAATGLNRIKQQQNSLTKPTLPPLFAPAPLAALPSIPKDSSSSSKSTTSSPAPLLRRGGPGGGRHMPPKRAASDLYGRFHKCKQEMNQIMRRIHSGLELAEEEQGDELELETKGPRLERPRSRPESVKNRVLKPDLEVPEEEEEEEEEEGEVSAKDHNSVSLLSSPIELDFGNRRKGSRNLSNSSVSPARSELLPSIVAQGDVLTNQLHEHDSTNNSEANNGSSNVDMATTKNSSWWLESSVGKDEVDQDAVIPLESRNQGQTSGGGDLWFHSSVTTDV